MDSLFTYSKFIKLLFLLLALVNCKSPETIRFSNAFPYTALYEMENEKLQEIDKIPNGIKLIATNKEMRFDYKTFCEIIYNNKKGWVEESKLQDKVGKFYFGVDTPKGINLREEPNQKSKTIDFLPFDTIGEILEWNDREEIIQTKKGYWIRINYNEKKGWIFSGFLTIDKSFAKIQDRTGGSDSELDFYRNFRNAKGFLEAKESDFSKEEISKLEIIERIDFYSYLILKIRLVRDGNEFKKILFHNTVTNQYYSFNTKDWMDNGDIIQFKNPMDRAILYNEIECCHGQISSYFLFFLKNKIIQVPFHPDTDGYCFMNAVVGGFKPYIKNRYNAQSKTIYTFAKHGKCPDDEDMKRIDIERKDYPDRGYYASPKKFTASQFIILKWDDNSVVLEKYFENEIPNKFKKDWENASPENNYIADPSKFLND